MISWVWYRKVVGGVVCVFDVGVVVVKNSQNQQHRNVTYFIIIQANPDRTELKGPEFYFELSEISSWSVVKLAQYRWREL